MNRLYNSWNNVLEILKVRGYEIPEDHLLDLDSFQEWIGEDETEARKEMSQVYHNPKKGTNILTYWTFNFGTADVQRIIEHMKEMEVSSCIAIHLQKVTPYAKTSLRQLRVQGIIIEPFSEAELQYNCLSHQTVPKHIICSKKKKDEILTAYNTSIDKFPKIKSTDPVARSLGAVKGQMVKIVRPSESVGKVTIGKESKVLFDITYRIVE